MVAQKSFVSRVGISLLYLETSLVDPLFDLYRRLALGFLFVFFLVQTQVPRLISDVIGTLIPTLAPIIHKAI